MRGPNREELMQTPPPGLRLGSKTAQAYLEVRRKILHGDYAPGEMLVPRQIEESYHINNTTTQMLLVRLANEGLVEVLPVREHAWPNNASLNVYRVADIEAHEKLLLSRQDGEQRDSGPTNEQEILLVKIQYADAQIASLLSLAEGDKVVWYRQRERGSHRTILAITDTYAPFWFAEALPELERGERDLMQLMRQVGRQPAQCMETVEVVQARSVERVLFDLSPDDPAPTLKVQREISDEAGHPLSVQFVTLRADRYRLRYAFPLTEPQSR
jgi:DNA-binding GntR family transcriptional regulator